MLLEIKAVHFNAETPFTLASGLPSPTYIDCRKLISYPRIRSTLMDFLTVTVMRDAGFEAFDNIAGGETAGIPFAALVAERLALPMTYVRKKPKGYGRNARIEGAMTEGQRVLLVEDLTTDGGSKLSFVDAIRETGATCAHTAVIFYYGIFPETDAAPGRSWRGAAPPLHLVGRAGRGARHGGLRCRRRWPRWRPSCTIPAPGRRPAPGHEAADGASTGLSTAARANRSAPPGMAAFRNMCPISGGQNRSTRLSSAFRAGPSQAYQALASAPPNRHDRRHRRQTGQDNLGGQS